MSVAAKIPQQPRWADICTMYPDQWVCLADVELLHDGSIGSARVLGHDRSMRRALAAAGAGNPEMMAMHTAGRPMRANRIEMTDEIRDIVRPGR